MLNLQLAHKYAAAIFEIAKDEGKLDEYGKELTKVSSELFAADGVKEYFSDPRIEPSAKKELVKRAFDGELSKIVYNFLMLLVDKRRISLIDAITDDFRALSNAEQGIVIADVTVASALGDAQRTTLQKKLSEVTGKKIQMRIHEDAGIIGGVVVKIGDKRIDGSVKGRLMSLTQELMNKR